MSEFIHVYLINKRPVGTNLGLQIPLHMTLLHWFKTNHSLYEVINKTKIALEPFKTTTLTGTKLDLFGADKNIPVTRIDKTPYILQIHLALKSAMEELNALFDERWTGTENWNPHVTHQANTRIAVADKIKVDDVDLIIRQNEKSDRSIIKRFSLD
jgi:2'-5' RNA ligase